MSRADDDSVPEHRKHADTVNDLYGDRIRAAAAELRAQYPDAGIDFLVHCLECDLGLRAAAIRRALAVAEQDDSADGLST